MAPAWLRAGFRALGAIAPEAGARLAERLWMTPPRYRPRPEQQALAVRAERLVVHVDGAPVHALAWGEGPPVLLVHGWGGAGIQLAPFVEPLLARGHAVIALDAPGHGESRLGKPSIPAFARAIDAVSRRVGGTAAIVAHSFGAAAVAYGLANGARTGRVVFLGPAADMLAASQRFAHALGIGHELLERMRRRVERRVRIAMKDVDVPNLARSLDTPLLVVHDEDDRDVPVEEGEAIARAWRGAELLRTSGLGHRRILREPHVIGRALEFLARDQAAAACFSSATRS